MSGRIVWLQFARKLTAVFSKSGFQLAVARLLTSTFFAQSKEGVWHARTNAATETFSRSGPECVVLAETQTVSLHESERPNFPS